MSQPTDARWFREVLGQYPTGVCVVTATHESNGPAGFVVGSFTSVSLDPPLVAFFPDKQSTSWPKIQAAGSFCVNILSADQEHLCRQFSAKTGDKFEGVAVRPSGSGSPILEDAVAWIDCDLESVTSAGDHYIVIGRVRELAVENPALPLLFFQGGYGRFTPLSLAAASDHSDMTNRLREIDLIRSEMEALAEHVSARCVATVADGDSMTVLASAGGTKAGGRATLVGLRLPFTLPYVSAFAAWFSESELEAWLKPLSAPERGHELGQIESVRRRGYSVGLLGDAQREFASALRELAENPHAHDADHLRRMVGQLDYDPPTLDEAAKAAIRVIAAPVFRASGEVACALTIYGFSHPEREGGIDYYINRLLTAAQRATELISERGHAPTLKHISPAPTA